jgi:hypothetical protein
MCITCPQYGKTAEKIPDPYDEQSLRNAYGRQWEYVSLPWMTCEHTMCESHQPSNHHNRFY